MNPDLPTVRIVHTGGTIASKVDYTTGRVTAQFEPSELVEHVPELLNIANLDVHKIGNMFSEDIRPNHWNQIIDASERAFADGCVGVVVTHGTDTLHITAAVAFAWCGRAVIHRAHCLRWLATLQRPGFLGCCTESDLCCQVGRRRAATNG